MTKSTESNVTYGSGNVFADLGFADADDRLVKSDLALRIVKAVKALRLTRAAAAECLGIDQASVACLLDGKLQRFSTAQLMVYLNALGHDVEIVVRKSPGRQRGKLSVQAV